MYECLPTNISMQHILAWCPRRPEVVIKTLGTGVTGDGCEFPDLGAGNLTQVLFKSSKCSQLLSHLYNPIWAFILQFALP